MHALLEMSSPMTGADLQQFLCAANWMRRSIPEYTRITKPLTNALEEVYKSVGKRTRKAAAKINLQGTVLWSHYLQKKFEEVKKAIHAVAPWSTPILTSSSACSPTPPISTGQAYSLKSRLPTKTYRSKNSTTHPLSFRSSIIHWV